MAVRISMSILTVFLTLWMAAPTWAQDAQAPPVKPYVKPPEVSKEAPEPLPPDPNYPDLEPVELEEKSPEPEAETPPPEPTTPPQASQLVKKTETGLYRYVDDSGHTYYVSDLSQVPERYRKRAHALAFPDAEKNKATTPAEAPATPASDAKKAIEDICSSCPNCCVNGVPRFDGEGRILIRED